MSLLTIENLHATVAVAALPLLAGCLGTTPKERAEIAAWEDCTADALAERRDAEGRLRMTGQAAYFEVTYECRALFPDIDGASSTTAGRQLLSRLYRRTVLSKQTTK